MCLHGVIHYALVCLEGRKGAVSCGGAVAPLTHAGIMFCVRFMVDADRRNTRLPLCSYSAMSESLAPYRALTCGACTRTYRLAHNLALHMRRAHCMSFRARPRHPPRVGADASDCVSGAYSSLFDRARVPQPPTAPSASSSAGLAPLPRAQPRIADVDRRGIVDAGARLSRPAQDVSLRIGGQLTTDDAAISDDHLAGSTAYIAIADDLQPATKKQLTNVV